MKEGLHNLEMLIAPCDAVVLIPTNAGSVSYTPATLCSVLDASRFFQAAGDREQARPEDFSQL